MELYKILLIIVVLASVGLMIAAAFAQQAQVSDADMAARLRVYARQCDEDLGAKRGTLALMEAARDKLQAELTKLKAEKAKPEAKPEEKK